MPPHLLLTRQAVEKYNEFSLIGAEKGLIMSKKEKFIWNIKSYWNY